MIYAVNREIFLWKASIVSQKHNRRSRQNKPLLRSEEDPIIL